MKRYSYNVPVAAAALLLLAACVNPLAPPEDREGVPAGIAAGKGAVYILTGAGAARTALPGMEFDHYEYLFAKAGEAAAPMTPSGGAARFELYPGNWTVTVRAYAEAGADTLAAEGSESFTVSERQEQSVTVRLSPITGEGTGSLAYTLNYPAGAAVASFTLTLLAGEDEIDLKAGAQATATALTGSAGAIDSGYYVARAVLEKNGVTVGKTEVVHIYQNMTTALSLEFVENEFTVIVVVSGADSGPGTLRDALGDAGAGATILIDLPPDNRVITLTSGPLTINRNLTLLGNGATLTQTGTYGLMRVSGGSGTIVHIRRLHFKGGWSQSGGGAIINSTRLTLESCIFSDNHAVTNGGAVSMPGSSSAESLTIRGSTFYGNTAINEGGAIYYGSRPLTLEGNLFWGNTAASGNVVYGTNLGAVSSAGFNVSDKASGFDAATGSGWTFKVSSDKQIATIPITPASFEPLLGSDGDELFIITARPSLYPSADFYGADITAMPAAAGAVQTRDQTGGFFLDYAAQGPGTVEVTAGDVNGGIVPSPGGPVTLTAAAAPNGELRYWIIDGVGQPASGNTLDLSVNAHTKVRALFYVKVTAFSGSGPGTLPSALLDAGAGGGVILPDLGAITLDADLNHATDIDIEGNGTLLNLNGHKLSINNPAKVSVSRLHFTGGRSDRFGGAISNSGDLTLESCIFSNNEAVYQAAWGGALYTFGTGSTLTVRGCTFYGNRATGGASAGGAIYRNGGTLSLTGNLFCGNTAASGSVVGGGSVSSGGFNVSDKVSGTDAATGSGWTFSATDIQAPARSFSITTFKPFAGGAALNVISSPPADYPAKDFYGETIATPAAAGAVQTPAAHDGFLLNYAASGPGTVNGTVGTAGANLVITSGQSVTLTAQANGGVFRHWTVNGDIQGAQVPPEQITISADADKIVRAVFSLPAVPIIGTADSGPGSLREALEHALAGDILTLAGQTITLSSPLTITTSLTIEGMGATLTQTGMTPSDTSQLLRINTTGAEVRISRLRFKGARTTSIYGGAIYHNNSGNLTLESCIFSDNEAANGGAVYTSGTVSTTTTISGCTFYGNRATGNGGAINKSGYINVNLTGNLFWGNTAASGNILSGTLNITSNGYNVSDMASGTNTTTGSGWAFNTGQGDKQVTSLSFSPVSFKPLQGSGALNVITGSLPGGYPVTDFYGMTRAVPAAAGAVQTGAAPGTGWALDYAAQGPGTVVLSGVTPDADGLISGGSATLTASPNSSAASFAYWTVNGAKQGETSHVLNLDMDGHKIVRAVFSAIHTVTSGADRDEGSLREALTNAAAGDTIVLDGQTIMLQSPLPVITKSIVIEGNGATLTQIGFTPGTASQLLRITGGTTEVRISRLHFKGGRATNNGAAIYNTGNLTLESCIFSDNETSGTQITSNGGAIYTNTVSLTVLGCTFSGNKAGTGYANGRGGAIYRSGGSVFLTGNLFSGNTVTQYSPVVYYANTGATSSGYNVSDKASGYNTTETISTGWTFHADDRQLTDVTFDGDFRPASGTSLNFITVLPGGFPATYFNGTARGANSTPGAMPAQ
jgi:hypothetical protein